MALMLPGGVAAAISGSLDGATHKQTRYGQVIAKRARKTRSTTVPALRARARFASAQSRWYTVSDTVRQLWTVASESVNRPDPFGTLRPLQPVPLFLSQLAAPPSGTFPGVVVPPILSPRQDMQGITLDPPEAGPWTIQLITAAGSPAARRCPLFGARSFATLEPRHWGRWRLLAAALFNSGGSTDIQPLFEAAFGPVPAGEWIAVAFYDYGAGQALNGPRIMTTAQVY